MLDGAALVGIELMEIGTGHPSISSWPGLSRPSTPWLPRERREQCARDEPAHDVDSETSSGLWDASGGSSIRVEMLDLDVKAVADVTAVSVAARQQRAGLIR